MNQKPKKSDYTGQQLAEKKSASKPHKDMTAGSKRRQSDLDDMGDSRKEMPGRKSGDLSPALRGRVFVVSTDFDEARGKTGRFKLAKDTLVERIGKAKGLVQVRCFHDARIQGLVPRDILSELPASAFKKQDSASAATRQVGNAPSSAEPQHRKTTAVEQAASEQNGIHATANKANDDASKALQEAKQDAGSNTRQGQDDAAGINGDAEEAPKLTNAERAQARQRYREKLQAFASARGADGTNGKPAKSRSDLMAARKAKEDRRAARKKEQRARAKEEEEERESAESEASRLIGGFGVAGLAGPGAASTPESFTFNHMETDTPRSQGKRKPDAKGALALAEKRERRIAGYDEAKRARVQEQDAWSMAQRRISGEKSKDNTALLRRSIKRRDKAKKKSGDAWKKRQEGVQAGIKARQQRRTENLKKRRPGFEGTFKLAKRHV